MVRNFILLLVINMNWVMVQILPLSEGVRMIQIILILQDLFQTELVTMRLLGQNKDLKIIQKEQGIQFN